MIKTPTIFLIFNTIFKVIFADDVRRAKLNVHRMTLM